jgi:hypothetical protein
LAGNIEFHDFRTMIKNPFVAALLLQNNSSAILVIMNTGRKAIITRQINTREAISWLLIAAILLVAFLPAHYHLHHLYDDDFSSAGAAHAHVIDLHVMNELNGQSHHDEAASIAALPDVLMKKTNPDFFPFILLAMVLLLLPVFNRQINIQLNSRSAKFKQRYHHFAPPLRSPPLH